MRLVRPGITSTSEGKNHVDRRLRHRQEKTPRRIRQRRDRRFARLRACIPEEHGLRRGVELVGLGEEERRSLARLVLRDAPASEVTWSPGGSALNAMRAAKYCIRELLGGGDIEVAFLGAVGLDEVGTRLKRACRAAGVAGAWQVFDDAPTGVCCSFVCDGERTLVTVPGAYKLYSPEPLKVFSSTEAQLVGRADIVYVTSFVLSNANRAEAARLMAEKTRVNGKQFALNLSSEGMLRKPDVLRCLLELLPFCDFVFGNKAEFKALGVECKLNRSDRAREYGVEDEEGNNGSDVGMGESVRDQEGEDEPETVLMSINRHNQGLDLTAMIGVARRIKRGGFVVQTRQEDDAILASADAVRALPGIEHISLQHQGKRKTGKESKGSVPSYVRDVVSLEPAMPVPQHLVKDSNGASDSFVGGFLSGMLAGSSVAEAAKFGHKCAAVCLQQTGCTFPSHIKANTEVEVY